MVEIPHGWTNIINHSSSQQFVDKLLSNGLFTGGTGRQKGRQACYLSAAHPQERVRRYPIKKVGSHNSSPTFTTSGIPMQFMKLTDVVKANNTGLKFYQTLSYVVVHFGDFPAECIARVVGYDKTILCERPSEVTPQAQAIQPDVCASGDRFVHQDQFQNRLNITRSCVN